jgi:hypothetical protein
MRDPVISIYGYTFERRAIMNWLTILGNNFCPCSGKDMTIHDLITARNLKNEINTWRAENGLPSDSIIGRTVLVMEEGHDEASSSSSCHDNDDNGNRTGLQDSHNHQEDNLGDISMEHDLHKEEEADEDIDTSRNVVSVVAPNMTNNHETTKNKHHTSQGNRMRPMPFALRKLLRVHPDSI